METKPKFIVRFGAAFFILSACGAGLVEAAATNGVSSGLVATATDGQHRVVFVTPTANFNLKPHQSIHPQLKPEFKAEWNGFLTIVRSGQYRIDGDAHVYLDGNEVK